MIPSLPVALVPMSNNATQIPVAPAAGGQPDFGATLLEMMKGTAQSVTQAEAVALDGIQGRASVQQVVASVMQAEEAVQSMTAIRDKIVGAYLEISRMQI